jgi:FkbM family methyltransferase
MLLKKNISTFLLSTDFLASAPGRSLQETPLKFIDVGARGGVHDIVWPIAKYTSVVGFEPNIAECERMNLENKRTQQWADMQILPVALADTESEHTLYMLSSNTNDSLLPPNENFSRRYAMEKWKIIGTEKLQSTTLDKVLQECQLGNHGEFIKLDTQGTEYEVLQGAKTVLQKNTVAVMTEVSFCEIYQGQKLFSEIELLLRQYGFSFYGFGMTHRRSKKQINKKEQVTAERLMYADAIFFKDPFDREENICTLSERQTYVLFVLALLLGYFDYAQELADKTWLLSSTEEEKKRIYQLIRNISTQPQQEARNALEKLYEQVTKNPHNANIDVGHFVDSRRLYCDYDDVCNVSPLPEFYTE